MRRIPEQQKKKNLTCIKQACDIPEKEYIIIKENLKLSCKWIFYIGSNTILQKKCNYMKCILYWTKTVNLT